MRKRIIELSTAHNYLQQRLVDPTLPAIPRFSILAPLNPSPSPSRPLSQHSASLPALPNYAPSSSSSASLNNIRPIHPAPLSNSAASSSTSGTARPPLPQGSQRPNTTALTPMDPEGFNTITLPLSSLPQLIRLGILHNGASESPAALRVGAKDLKIANGTVSFRVVMNRMNKEQIDGIVAVLKQR